MDYSSKFEVAGENDAKKVGATSSKEEAFLVYYFHTSFLLHSISISPAVSQILLSSPYFR